MPYDQQVDQRWGVIREMQKDQEQTEYSLDSLLEMDWGREVASLAFFLNLTVNDLVEMFPTSTFKGKLPLEHLLDFHKEISYILGSLDSIPSEKHLRQIEQVLSAKLAPGRAKNQVVVTESLQARVELHPEALIDELWADFIFLFLGRDWNKELGRCVHCTTWFQKFRKSQMYCSESCKNKAYYHRDRKKRSARYGPQYKDKPA